jgi:hypothetical protein
VVLFAFITAGRFKTAIRFLKMGQNEYGRRQMEITLAQAIQQLRDDIREAISLGKDQDVVFTPRGIELELAVTFGTEAKAGGGFKLLTFLDLSTEVKGSNSHQHKIKLTLDVTDDKGSQIKVSSDEAPANLR